MLLKHCMNAICRRDNHNRSLCNMKEAVAVKFAAVTKQHGEALKLEPH